MSFDVAFLNGLISLVDAVDVLEAYKRIPDELRGVTFFGANDRWLYVHVGGPNTCVDCAGYEGLVFFGDSLRAEFKWLRIVDENTINPNVHPHCNCFLTRVS